MAYAAGVDVGSTQTKAVVIDEDRTIVGRALIDTGANVVQAAEHAFEQTLTDAGIPVGGPPVDRLPVRGPGATSRRGK